MNLKARLDRLERLATGSSARPPRADLVIVSVLAGKAPRSELPERFEDACRRAANRELFGNPEGIAR